MRSPVNLARRGIEIGTRDSLHGVRRRLQIPLNQGVNRLGSREQAVLPRRLRSSRSIEGGGNLRSSEATTDQGISGDVGMAGHGGGGLRSYCMQRHTGKAGVCKLGVSQLDVDGRVLTGMLLYLK